MKNKRFCISALCVLAIFISTISPLTSCRSANIGKVSSVMTEKENQSTSISSEVSKEETSSDITSSDAQTSSQEKNENNEVFFFPIPTQLQHNFAFKTFSSFSKYCAFFSLVLSFILLREIFN